jgi:hypothetical protein
MYLSILPAPLSVESSTPSKQTLLREEYMTKQSVRKSRRQVEVQTEQNAALGPSMTLLLGQQWFSIAVS